MRILHLPYSFFPFSTGGKEVFVYQLIKNSLPANEHLVLVHRGEKKENYCYNGVSVQVLPATATNNSGYSYYSSLYNDLGGFEDFLNDYKPSLVHFHDQGEGASLSHLRACKKAGIKTLLTYHSPGQSCLQRSLLFKGKMPCDGFIDDTRCTICRNAVAGMPAILANILSHISLPFDKNGKFIKRNSTELFHTSWLEFYDTVDGIQVHAGWVKEMLLLNNIPTEKIHFIEMGGHTSIEKISCIENYDAPLKLVFTGRCTDIKGVHLLIDAVQMMPKETAMEIHFFGPYWDDTDYGKQMLVKIKDDKRFIKPRLINQEEMIGELRKMDVCIIPSIWPETGPFTVFDAFAAALPIVGANYGGIAERITDGVDGLLFEWNNALDLSAKLDLLINDRHLLYQLKLNTKPNHTFTNMAKDFSILYKTLA